MLVGFAERVFKKALLLYSLIFTLLVQTKNETFFPRKSDFLACFQVMYMKNWKHNVIKRASFDGTSQASQGFAGVRNSVLHMFVLPTNLASPHSLNFGYKGVERKRCIETSPQPLQQTKWRSSHFQNVDRKDVQLRVFVKLYEISHVVVILS